VSISADFYHTAKRQIKIEKIATIYDNFLQIRAIGLARRYISLRLLKEPVTPYRIKIDRLDDEDIGIIWARHYPKRAERASSMSLCVTLTMIIKQRAKSADQYDPAKLDQVLASAHVSREQFETVESESAAQRT
jgi:hypothetical protein